MFDVVVVGADASATAKKAVEAATEMAKMSGGVLHIVTAYEPKSRTENYLPDAFRHLTTEGEIDTLMQDLSFIPKSQGIAFQLHEIPGEPAEVLIKAAEDLDADLIVVGNKGMHGARRMLGSVPNSVAHGAPCSVAIIDTSD